MKAPKKKKSKVQQAARLKKFAVTGLYSRGGQAASQASQGSRKHQGKRQPPAKAQQAALHRALKRDFALAARRAGKNPVKPKVRAAMMPVTPETRLPGYSWVLGCNDEQPTCAAAAVANHLYAATGLVMAEHEILALHEMAGGEGEKGASIADVLETLAASPKRFCNGKFLLNRWFTTDINVIMTGLVVGIDLPHGSHAVLSHPDGMVSWGRVMPWRGEPEEAWALEWVW